MTTTAAATLAQTPLYDWHVAQGARMVDFAGWAMPVQYRSIVDEHQATRHATALFDISHMGRLTVDGPEAREFLDYVLTRSVRTLRPDQIRYSLVCNTQGGILDDVLVYGRDPEAGSPFSLVVNASNRAKINDWLRQQRQQLQDDRRAGADVELADQTVATAMIAVQGPTALDCLRPHVDCDPARLKYYCGQESTLLGKPCYLSRTGYTGEDGCEIICAASDATAIWTALLATDPAATDGTRPPTAAGLGARDTLRLEAGMPLYGHELSEDVNPIAAGLQFAVMLDGRPFVGEGAIAKFAADPQQPRRVGLALEGRRAARQGAAVLQADEPIGTVTSGTHSPTLDRPIAMASVTPTAATPGTQLTVDVRGKAVAATVVELPFYKRAQ